MIFLEEHVVLSPVLGINYNIKKRSIFQAFVKLWVVMHLRLFVKNAASPSKYQNKQSIIIVINKKYKMKDKTSIPVIEFFGAVSYAFLIFDFLFSLV